MCSFTMFVDNPIPGKRPCPCCGDPMDEALSQCAECDAEPVIEGQCVLCGERFTYVARQHWTLGEIAYGERHECPPIRLCYACGNAPLPRYADRY